MKSALLSILLLFSMSCTSTVEPQGVPTASSVRKQTTRVATNYPAFLTGSWKLKAYSSSQSPVNFIGYKNATGCYLTNRWLNLDDSGTANIADLNGCSPSTYTGFPNEIDFFAYGQFSGETISWASGVTASNPSGSTSFTRMSSGGGGPTEYVTISFDPFSSYTIMYWTRNGLTIQWERAAGGPF